MKYCKKCKRLSFTGDEICSCGKKLTTDPAPDVPCELIRTEETESVQVASCLTQAEIPFSDVMTDKVQMMWGNVSGKHVFYVPLCFLKKSCDAVSPLGISELPPYYDKLDYYDGAEWKEMSPLKRNIVRILSVAAFAVIVYLCIVGVDAAAAFVKGLFV